MTEPRSTPSAEHRVFEARLASLPAIVAFVEEFGARNALSRADALRLTLVLEELFANTVHHGGEGGAPRATIDVTLTAAPDEVAVLYEDTAPPFDPLSRAPLSPAELAAPVETRPVGGLGLHLVRQFAAGARYARVDGRNRLWLRLRRFGR